MDEDGCCLGCLAYVWMVGCGVASAISWSVHHSILWAALHGLASWGYVIYYGVTTAWATW